MNPYRLTRRAEEACRKRYAQVNGMLMSLAGKFDEGAGQKKRMHARQSRDPRMGVQKKWNYSRDRGPVPGLQFVPGRKTLRTTQQWQWETGRLCEIDDIVGRCVSID